MPTLLTRQLLEMDAGGVEPRVIEKHLSLVDVVARLVEEFRAEVTQTADVLPAK